MSMESRLRDASVRRETEVDDGFGAETTTEAEVLANVKCEVFPVSPWDREALVQKFGIEIGRAAILYKGALADGAQLAEDVGRWDIIRFTSTERYQVLGTHPVRGGAGVIHHYSLLLMQANEE